MKPYSILEVPMKPNQKIAPGKAAAEAARRSTKSGQKISRGTTASRGEIRQQTVHRQGHTK
jgi:hypothetical protein